MLKRQVQFPSANVALFKRWRHAGYAIFASLGRIIRIAVLPAAYTILTFGQHAFAQQDSIDSLYHKNIDAVLVERQRLEAKLASRLEAVEILKPSDLKLPAVLSLQDLLAQLPGVDIRERGPAGVQADLAVRGGGFDQFLILLNGVDITDAQTGHHNLNIPIRPEAIEYIEVLSGPGARQYGPGAFAGAINIVTKKKMKSEGAARFKAGQYAYYDGYMQGNYHDERIDAFAYVGGSTTEGFTDNTDHLVYDALVVAQGRIPHGDIALQLGHQSKTFGANSFYHPKFPNQYETTRSTIASLTYRAQWSGFGTSASISYRNGKDKFQLFRDTAPQWYKDHNYHQTHLISFRAAAHYSYKISKTQLAAIIRHDRILSNNLGRALEKPVSIRGVKDSKYTLHEERTNYTIALDQTLKYNAFSTTFGALATFNSTFGWEYGAGLEIAYMLPHEILLRAAANRAYRLPTFTDLYYHVGQTLGNVNLRPENSINCELGISHSGEKLSASLLGYYRLGENIIDWVQQASTPGEWKAQNNDAPIHAFGTELSLCWRPNFPGLHSIRATYAFNHLMHNRKDSITKGSVYAFTNLRHQVNVSAICPIPGGFSIRPSLSVGQRAGEFVDVKNDNAVTKFPTVVRFNLAVDYTRNQWRLFIECRNVIGSKQFDYPFVPLPGRWFIGGVSYNL